MTNAAVEWTLAQLQSVVDSQPADHPLKRINRDDSTILEGDIKSRTDDLTKANYVGAAHVDRSEEPVGTEYDLDVDEIVGIRIEGLVRGEEYGHIDPDGQVGVVFDGDPGLVQEIKSALYAAREYPDAGRSTIAFTELSLTNHAPQSHLWGDYYRYDFDVVFEGYEELP